MNRLRQAHFFARLVLAWFVLALGVAVASPVINPQGMELVCSGSGAMKLLVKSDDGTQVSVGHTLDCPLCATVGAPPPVIAQQAVPAQPLSYALQPLPAAHIAALTAAPLPARGPPSLL